MTSSSLDDVRLYRVDTLDEAFELKRWLGERRPILGVDTETEGLDYWRDDLRMIQVGDAMSGWSIRSPEWLGFAREILEGYAGPMVLQNAKFDLHTLHHNGGITLPRARLHETKAMAHLIAPLGPQSLKAMGDAYIDPRAGMLGTQLDRAMMVNGWSWATVPYDFEPYWAYGALDPVLTARLAELFWPKVQPYRELYELELAVQWIVTDMEERGIRIDLDYCRAHLADLRGKIALEEAGLREEYGLENPGSTKQVADSFEAAGVHLTARTEKGAIQVDEKVLKHLVAETGNDLARRLLDLRVMMKHANTYFGNFLDYADSDGFLHSSINTLGARTGRMSISRPPLQGVPRTKLARDAFVPRESGLLIAADYDQIELRIMADYAREPAMLEAIHNGIDLHTYMASLIYGVAVEDVTPEQRYVTKGSNFATIYGAGLAKFAEQAGIPLDQAASFRQMYGERFAGIARFIRTVQDIGAARFARTGEGYITTWGGRRSPASKEKLYTLVNYLIQGTAADVLKRRMVELDRAGLGEYMILPIHDELLFDVPETSVEEAVATIQEVMPENEAFSVPLSVGVDVLERWGDKYE